MRKEKEEFVLYQCLHRKIRRNKDYFGNIKKKDIDYILGVQLHIEREDRNRIIAELIELGFIEARKEGHLYYYKVL